MTQRVDTIETVVDVFNIAMDIQELYLKKYIEVDSEAEME